MRATSFRARRHQNCKHYRGCLDGSCWEAPWPEWVSTEPWRVLSGCFRSALRRGPAGLRAHAGKLRACQYDLVSSARLEWAVAGSLAGWALARLTAADRFRPLEPVAVPLLALTPQATVAAVLATLLLRRKGPSATAALAGAALAAVVAPRAIPRRQPTAVGPVLRVLTVNLLTGRAAGGRLVELARSTGADVLFLQELTEDAVSRLTQAGLGALLPHEMADVIG